MANNVIVKTLCKFVFTKRILIPIVISALLYMGITFVWRQWKSVPVPEYIPKDDHWKLIAKEYDPSWILPCVYTRFVVGQPQSTVADQIKKVIFALGKWDSSSEKAFKSVLDEIQEDPRFSTEDKEILHQMQESRLSPLRDVIEKGYFIRTERPFVVFSWADYEEGVIHYCINVRLIATGENNTIVEIWDAKTPDL